MVRAILPLGAALLLATAALSACAGGTALRGSDETTGAGMPATARVAVVHRSPGCTCCHEWESYLRANGYQVSAADDPDIAGFKLDNGVPGTAQSCHTALIGGYVVEGHVPIEAIEDLLVGGYAIDGIALPGMPPGSPGMSGERQGPFEVLTLAEGQTTPFGAY